MNTMWKIITKAEIVQLITEGKMAWEIAVHFDCHYSTIRKYVQEFKLDFPKNFYAKRGKDHNPGNPKYHMTKERILKYLDDGKCAYQIANDLGCQRLTIKGWIKKFNIVPPVNFYKRSSQRATTVEKLTAHRNKMSGENNPFFGCKHTAENRLKMKLNHGDIRGEKNGFKKAMQDKLFQEKFSNIHKNRWKSVDKVAFGNKSRSKKITLVIGEIPLSFWNRIISGAVVREIEFKITPEYIWNLFLKQDRKCSISNKDLIFGNRLIDITASLDRIDSSKGYIEGNVQWVLKQLNIMKNDLPQSTFIYYCKLVANANQDLIIAPPQSMNSEYKQKLE